MVFQTVGKDNEVSMVVFQIVGKDNEVSMVVFQIVGKDNEVSMVVIQIVGHGWMDELGFYVPSIVFQSFRDDERVNMKGSVQ